MTTPTEIIARALCAAQGCRATENELARATDEAAAVITALKDAGYAIVPVEPTPEMLELGMYEAEACTEYFTTRASCLPGHVWGAMIDASGKGDQ